MNLDKYIRMGLIKLSANYEISLTEITKVVDRKIKRLFILEYKSLETGYKIKDYFGNKRELVKWLMNRNQIK